MVWDRYRRLLGNAILFGLESSGTCDEWEMCRK